MGLQEMDEERGKVLREYFLKWTEALLPPTLEWPIYKQPRPPALWETEA